ncbi:hypothetical protein ACFXC8_29390 [Streptomyces sp. NPDC059441]|uniref:hypothetical protein n=1 Tax=Streptomyces sp. NPDC059441 TaxID=3346829 RepID=UPI0036A320F9
MSHFISVARHGHRGAYSCARRVPSEQGAHHGRIAKPPHILRLADEPGYRRLHAVHRRRGTRYTDAAVNQLRADGFDVRDEDVARLSPFCTAAAIRTPATSDDTRGLTHLRPV